jgi:hypothetical protein
MSVSRDCLRPQGWQRSDNPAIGFGKAQKKTGLPPFDPPTIDGSASEALESRDHAPCCQYIRGQQRRVNLSHPPQAAKAKSADMSG